MVDPGGTPFPAAGTAAAAAYAAVAAPGACAAAAVEAAAAEAAVGVAAAAALRRTSSFCREMESGNSKWKGRERERESILVV